MMVKMITMIIVKIIVMVVLRFNYSLSQFETHGLAPNNNCRVKKTVLDLPSLCRLAIDMLPHGAIAA